MVKRPSPEITKDQVRKLLQVIKTSNTETARRDYLIFKLVIVHNFKPGWIIGTDRPVVDVKGGIYIEDLLDDSKVMVRVWSKKTIESAEVDIGRETMKELRWFAGGKKEGKLFNISVSRIEQASKTYAKQAGISDWKHVVPERLRNLLNPNAPVVFQKELDWIDNDILRQAHQMTKYYIINYCIENSIRRLISKTLSDKHGNEWWSKRASPELQKEVEKRQVDERNLPGAIRSENPLDYMMLRELREIMKSNWADFAERGLNKSAMGHAFVTLNQLRRVIAHNVELPEREKKRFEIFEADWKDLLAGS